MSKNTLLNSVRIIGGTTLLGLAQLMTAQTTPGTPTTSVGGEAIVNLLLLVVSLLLIGVGVALSRKGHTPGIEQHR